MIENITRLSDEDKLYMIYNPCTFSLPTRATINFYTTRWTADVELALSKDKIDGVKEEHEGLKLKQSYLMQLAPDEEICNIISKLYSSLWFASCETKEDIKNILYTTSKVYSNLFEKLRKKGFISDFKNFIVENFKYFLRLFSYKLIAHEIYLSNTGDVSTGDTELKEFTTKTLRLLINEFESAKETNFVTLLIYQILLYLDIKEYDIVATTFVNFSHYLCNTDIDQVVKKLDSLLSGKLSALTIIDRIKFTDEITDHNFVKFISNKTKERLKESYKKNVISDVLKNGELCIGDDIFGDTPISLSDLMVELAQLNIENIKNYIGENHIITLEIPEKDVGYLKLKEKLPVCKVLTRRNGFYTVTNYRGKPFLLFKMMNDSKCYGISFPSEYAGNRQVVIFDIPENRDYKLDI